MPRNLEIANRLREYAISKFGSLKGLADALGKTSQYMNIYYSGINSPGAKLRKELERLGCDTDWLMTGREERSAVREQGGVYSAGLGTIAIVPFLGRVAATPEGKQYFDDEDVPPGAGVPFFKDNGNGLFALEVENDSLINAQPEEIYPGDICIFNGHEQPKEGDIVAVQLVQSNDRMVKIFHRLNKTEIELRSANKFRNYPNVKLRRSEVATFGVYVGKIKLTEERKRRYGLRR